MTTKEYLYQLKEIDNLINANQEEVDRLRAIAEKTTSRIKEVNVMESSGNRMEDTIIKIVELENEINEEIDRLIDIKVDARRIVNQIEKIQYRTILIKYYFQNKTFEQTAVEMDKSYQWICELHGRALKEFSDIFEKR